MDKKASDTLSFQNKFQALNLLLLKTIRELGAVSHPAAAAAIQDLKSLAESFGTLQTGALDQMHEQKYRLTSLMEVSHFINSSLGLERVLEGVMDSLIALTRAERGFLMLFDSQGMLTVRVARGLAHTDLEGESFAFSRTVVQRVADSREPILTTNAQDDPRFEGQQSIIMHQLRSILCAPLRTKDSLLGVIYVDNRVRAGLFNEHDLEMLTVFAEQAAIAIENAHLFDGLELANRELEAANQELQTAYDATLKGWVRALDLRDKETRGHTQRVTILTRLLAKALGFQGEDLVHITRGAILHDIGKMGIPDSILLKPGGLTPEERDQMKQHTTLAYEMLSPIQFLRPALDIPYCHHEKWDGSGYPRGLDSEEIPFTARIFSIADVWDALTSNRPYRQAMNPEEVRQYIREQTSAHFDPQVVDTFLGLDDLPNLLAAEQNALPA
ncbi:MAG: GAF domain-containing protein [Chloroflexi bacterium]|nr:GAF domain-containing protein [Chloroflexota bacterium]